MIDAARTATAGLTRAMERFDAGAGRITRSGTDLPGAGGADLASAVTDLLQARFEVELNARVARSTADLQRRTLDILV